MKVILTDELGKVTEEDIDDGDGFILSSGFANTDWLVEIDGSTIFISPEWNKDRILKVRNER